MQQQTQTQSFWDGFAIGELTGRLKYESPAQIRQSLPLASLKDYRALLQKYQYSIVGINAHPSEPDQMLIVAEKTAEGTNPSIILAFARDDDFMNGWAAGCLSGRLQFTQPDRVEEWVRHDNLGAVQRVLDECEYVITGLRVHDENKKWSLITAQRQTEKVAETLESGRNDSCNGSFSDTTPAQE